MLDLNPKKYSLKQDGKLLVKTDWDSLWQHLVYTFADKPILETMKNKVIEYEL